MASTIATILLILVGVSLLYIAYRTITGRPVERRIVFIYIALAVALPLFMTLPAPVQVTPDVERLYDALEELRPGSKVLVSFDYDPPSAPELQPMAVAFMKYAFKHDLRVIVMGLWPQGPQLANLAIEEAMADQEIAAKNLEYGVDYVNLGFQSGNEFVIQAMGTQFKRMFPQDDRRIPYDSIPLMANVTNFSNVDFVFNLSSGKPGTIEWVQIAVDRFGATMGAGNTAVQAPQVYPYLRAKQLHGLLGGMSGAAEFEKIVEEPGDGTTFILSQMFAHAIVILFVIIGNAAFFTERRKQE
ncbi:hypothetical protein GF420_09925 [candidate division GN15 bacterium]|nr:hypothetical protein [candidate division GN15 bacterium]